MFCESQEEKGGIANKRLGKMVEKWLSQSKVVIVCDEHTDSIVDYYNVTHNKMVCNMCYVTNPKSDNTKFIPIQKDILADYIGSSLATLTSFNKRIIGLIEVGSDLLSTETEMKSKDFLVLA